MLSPLTATSISQGTSAGAQQSSQQGQRSSQSQASSFIPNYSETPILDSLAQYAEKMAPQVYSWGMQQYGNNQGDINELKRSADTLASGQRLAADVGQAEAGVEQGGAQALKNSKEELESFGIDPSSGRYAALDQASRVQTAAAAAGAGNVQRTSDIATSNAMKNQAISSELQNSNFGLGVAGAANNFTATGLTLKYPPLGQESTSSGEGTNTGESSGTNESQNYSISGSGTGIGSAAGSKASPSPGLWAANNSGAGMAQGGPVDDEGGMDPAMDEVPGGYDPDEEGGAVDPERSPSAGQQVDDVPAQLSAGEFVLPNDVVKWKGEEYFQKLISQSRQARQSIMQAHGQTQGHNLGGAV